MLTANEVIAKLKTIGHHVPFTVTFIKKDGSERVITGWLELPPKDNKQEFPENVPVASEEGGWKSFNINRVLSISL